MSKDKTNTSVSENNAPERLKRAYSKPVVVQHGNLREITLSVGRTGRSDNYFSFRTR